MAGSGVPGWLCPDCKHARRVGPARKRAAAAIGRGPATGTDAETASGTAPGSRLTSGPGAVPSKEVTPQWHLPR